MFPHPESEGVYWLRPDRQLDSMKKEDEQLTGCAFSISSNTTTL